MNAQNPLEELRDIHAPDPISWFPMAPGWWILLLLILCALSAIAWVLVRRYKARQYKREALLELSKIEQNFRESNDTIYLAFAVRGLIKRVLIFKSSRREVASRSEDEFNSLLKGLSSHAEASLELVNALNQSLYSKSPQVDSQKLIVHASAWIRGIK